MTTPHWIAISDALATQLATALGVSVSRRYTAYYDKQDVVDGKYLVVGSGHELQGKRGIDLLEVSVDVGYQRALPAPTPEYEDPKNNIPWLDAESTKVQAILDLFSAGDELSEPGPLRHADFAGATYLRWAHAPIYRPDMLRDNSIFTSVIRFDFRIED